MEAILGSLPRPIYLNRGYLFSLAELAEVLGHRVGIAGRNAVAGAESSCKPAALWAHWPRSSRGSPGLRGRKRPGDDARARVRHRGLT